MQETDRKWVAIAVLVASVAGLGALYYATSRSSSSSEPKRQLKKKTKGPESGSDGAATKQDAARSDVVPPSSEDLSKLTPKQRQELALSLKSQGNDMFKAGNMEKAIELYGRAIELQPKNAVLYCNRAACNAILGEPAKVIADCDEAIKRDPVYVKALNRRAVAHEQLKHLRDALYDFTAVTVLDGQQQTAALEGTERLLKALAEEAATELPSRTPALPSPTFVSAYLDAFRPKPCPGLPEYDEKKKEENPSVGFYLSRALHHLKHKRYEEADRDVTQAVEHIQEQDITAAHAYNVAGTLLFLKGDVDGAAKAFDAAYAIDPKSIDTMIKRSNLLMEKGDAEGALRTFDEALEVDPDSPDVYYHRGQVKFLGNDYPGCVQDFQKSIDLDPTFAPAYIQLGVSQYKLGAIEEAMNTFKSAMTRFPKHGDVYGYYGELLMDQGRFAEAMQNYDKAIALNPTNPMPYMNKATLKFQVYQDAPAAEELLRTALEKDPRCDLVYVQLANFLLPQGKVEESIGYFDKAVSLSRTKAELLHAVVAKESVLAQYVVSGRLPPEAIMKGMSG